MPPVVVLQEIRAPVEKVFNFVGNVETHPRIAPFSKEVRITSPGGNKGVGTQFHQIFHDRPECDSEIRVWEPHSKIVWHNFVGGSDKPAQIITYHFEQDGQVTQVLHTVDNDAYENQTLHRGGTEENLREMANLKRVVEEEKP
jgi:hypothetical protein